MDWGDFTDATSGVRRRDALGHAARILARSGSRSAALDAEVLLAHSLALTREELIASAELRFDSDQAERFAALLARRVEREPVAYIVGRQEFWSLDFQVSPDVLIPRSDTERLIEVTLGLAGQLAAQRAVRVLEIGTGSGVIAVALATELPKSQVVATDISAPALDTARRNAARNGVAERITFRCGDLFDALGETVDPFDLIVANPPYIRRTEVAALQPEVSRWEPRAALDGGADGLDFYRRIAPRAERYLTARGALALEIGADMGEEVLALLARAGFYGRTEIVHDYTGQERVVVARASAVAPAADRKN